MADSGSLHRLEGTTIQTGGLVVKKKSKETSARDDFKKPLLSKGSLLGLDVLAQRKRQLKEAQLDELQGEKRSKVESYREEEEDEIEDEDDKSHDRMKKSHER